MRVTLNEKDHVYTVDGEIASISVTELLKKHGLAPDYSGVSAATKEKSAKRGKQVHEDLEKVLNTADYEPKTEQGKQFKEWVSDNLDCGVGEQLLAYVQDGLIIAGTADVLGITKQGELIIGDHKNTAKFAREYVSWQVSIYDYFLRRIGEEKINGRKLSWCGASAFYCFHYNPESGDMTVYTLDKIPDLEIERLLECEKTGEKYERAELAIEPELREKFLAAEERFVLLETETKKAQEERDNLRNELCALMEKQRITSWESPDKRVLVSYIFPTDKIVVDSKKLKERYPNVFTECQKMSHTKAHLRVTVRDEGKGE